MEVGGLPSIIKRDTKAVPAKYVVKIVDGGKYCDFLFRSIYTFEVLLASCDSIRALLKVTAAVVSLEIQYHPPNKSNDS